MPVSRHPKGHKGGQFAPGARAMQFTDTLTLDEPSAQEPKQQSWVDLSQVDKEVRELMLDEIAADTDDDMIYISSRLDSQGSAMWPEALRAAADCGDPSSLADAVRYEFRWQTAMGKRMGIIYLG